MSRREIEDLQEAYQHWPTADDKPTLWALILRIRMERLVRDLSPEIILRPGANRVAKRLMLTIGEPGLTEQRRRERHRVVSNAIAAYKQICDLLHGRNPDPAPPDRDLHAWDEAVRALEREIDAVQPPARDARTQLSA